MILFTEIGRGVVPGPWLGTVVAATALAGTTSGAGLLDGTRLAALVDDPSDALGTGALLDGTVARRRRRRSRRRVRRRRLEDGAHAGRQGAGARGHGRTLDGPDTPSRHDRRPRRQGRPRSRADAAALRRMATVLVAAEAVGVAERTLEMSVEFAKVREQFGKPIGTFQAIKHRCADMATRAEVARAVVVFASVAVQDGEVDADFHVHSAKALAADAAIQNATDNVQNHGGMGYTWESDAHLYLKRARVLEHVCGSRMAHLDAIAGPWRAA